MEAKLDVNSENVFFEFDNDGILKRIIPEIPLIKYAARYYIIANKKYDTQNADDIKKIPELSPRSSKSTFPDITKMLEYILRMKAGDLWERKFYNEAILCYRKSNRIMFLSNVSWREDDFMRIYWCMIEAGKFDEAQVEKNFIEKNYKSKYDFTVLHKNCIFKALQTCREFNTDLVEVGDAGSIVSAQTAKYRKRIYSISGKDKRFPFYSDKVKMCESLLPFAFVEGISKPIFCELEEWVQYSNRPFCDDRTEDEIIAYNNWVCEVEKKKKKEINKVEYYKLYYGLPELVPKSLNAYSRMKNAGTDKFWELVEKAADTGIHIEI